MDDKPLAERLVEVGHRDPCCQGGEVGMLLGHICAGLRRQSVDLLRAHAVVEAFHHLLGHRHRVDEARVEAIAQVADALGDGVELHLLLAPVALHNEHLPRHLLFTQVNSLRANRSSERRGA